MQIYFFEEGLNIQDEDNYLSCSFRDSDIIYIITDAVSKIGSHQIRIQEYDRGESYAPGGFWCLFSSDIIKLTESEVEIGSSKEEKNAAN